MRTRGHHRNGAVALAGLTLLAIGTGAPAFAAEQPVPGKGSDTKSTPQQKELDVTAPARPTLGEAASTTLAIDATPPSAERFTVKAGTERDSRSRWFVATDPGTAYELAVDDATVQKGTVEGRTVKEFLDLADGNYDVRLELRDEVGNVRTLTETVAVAIPTLWVAAKDVSEENATERSFKVAAAPGTRGFLKIPGGATAKFELPDGRAAVTVDVTEGSYAAPRIFVADSHDRKGSVALQPFEVDLTAPGLRVSTDETAAERGVLSATIAAGAGDEVTWRLLADGDLVVMSGGFVADGTEQLLERPVAEGGYELVVTAVDAQGNQTVERATAAVAGVPLVNPDVVPALAITVALWVLVGGVVLLRRWSGRRAQRAGHGSAQRPRLRTKRARLAAAHAEAVAAYEQQLAVFQREDATWQQRRAELEQLVAVAQGGGVEVPGSEAVLRDGERAFFALPATLVELRPVAGRPGGKQAPVELEDGGLLVTDLRVVFTGDRSREWELSEVEQLRHVGHDLTLLPVAGQDTVSGVAYDDADLVRFYLQLAVARLDGTVGSVRAMLLQGVRSHELRRPQPPTPVGSAEVAEVAVQPADAPVGHRPMIGAPLTSTVPAVPAVSSGLSPASGAVIGQRAGSADRPREDSERSELELLHR